MPRRIADHRAQASVELVLATALVAVVMFAGWQLIVAGHTWWNLAEVARLSARAHYVAAQRGEPAAGRRRAREFADALLKGSPPRSRRVRADASGVVTASARIPLVGPFGVALGSGAGPRISARSRMSP
jgi:hypothetical protein